MDLPRWFERSRVDAGPAHQAWIASNPILQVCERKGLDPEEIRNRVGYPWKLDLEELLPMEWLPRFALELGVDEYRLARQFDRWKVLRPKSALLERARALWAHQNPIERARVREGIAKKEVARRTGLNAATIGRLTGPEVNPNGLGIRESTASAIVEVLPGLGDEWELQWAYSKWARSRPESKEDAERWFEWASRSERVVDGPSGGES